MKRLSTEELIATGKVPQIDLQLECAVQAACLEAAEAGLLQSAHDCSDGGVGVALAESCFSSLNRPTIGAEVALSGSLSSASELFSESPSRIIISFTESCHIAIDGIARKANCPFTILGHVGSDRLRIQTNGELAINTPVDELESLWRSSLARKLQAEAMAAGME